MMQHQPWKFRWPLLAADVAEVIGVNTANISGAPGLGLALAIRHVCPSLIFWQGRGPQSTGPASVLVEARPVETLTVAAHFHEAALTRAAPKMLEAWRHRAGYVGGPKLASLPELNTALRAVKAK